jgi:hypothetical protein
MTPGAIPPRFRPRTVLALALLAAGLAGCSTVRSWAQLGTNHPAQAGASISVPIGK